MTERQPRMGWLRPTSAPKSKGRTSVFRLEEMWVGPLSSQTEIQLKSATIFQEEPEDVVAMPINIILCREKKRRKT